MLPCFLFCNTEAEREAQKRFLNTFIKCLSYLYRTPVLYRGISKSISNPAAIIIISFRKYNSFRVPKDIAQKA